MTKPFSGRPLPCCRKLNSTAALITRGEAGMALLEKDKPIFTDPNGGQRDL